MADADTCDLIEEWARGALSSADVELPDDTAVSASAGGDGYTLVVELPSGEEGGQQLANSLQSVVVEAVESDPTLGGRFSSVRVAPAGVDLVAVGDTGARSMWELTLESDEESEDDESDEESDGDDDDESDEDDSESDGGEDADESDEPDDTQ